MKITALLLPAAAILLLAPSPARAADAKGCKDSPAMTRFPGSTLTFCLNKDDEEAAFPMGHGKPPKKIEGLYQRLDYNFPKTSSKAEVVRNIAAALRNAGFALDYDSGSVGEYVAHKGPMWIHEMVSAGGYYTQFIVVEKKLEQLMVADAAALLGGLNGNGHMVVNGIYFDTDQAMLKPESAAALKEVANLLKDNAALKLYVVGHTDNQGALAPNMELSRQRAAAVVHALTAEQGVAASRLAPYGDGPYAPVTTNDTEEGRALNRRVEVVKQ